MGQGDSMLQYATLSTGTDYTIIANNIYPNASYKLNGAEQTMNSGTQYSGELSNNSLYLLYCHGGSTWFSQCKLKLYYFKLTVGGTLVCDFIPCKNASGAVGLWDDVNSVFYQNAGTGSFTAGPEVSSAGSVLIDGTAYSVTGGRTLINGTGYAISKGRTLIGGTGYDITFDAGATDTPLSDFTPGSIVKLNESGSAVEFYVAKHDYESGLNGAGRTLLVRKECHSAMAFGSTSAYYNSKIRTWLNSTYKNLLDAGIQSAITPASGSMTIPCVYGGGSTEGVNISASVFTLSATELGKQPNSTSLEGSLLPIASTLDTESYWTRSPYSDYSSLVIYAVQSAWDAQPVNNSHPVRPCFTLPGTTRVDADNNVIV